MLKVDWTHRHFTDLALTDLHDLLALRVAVFVVEQRCPYQEIDGKDVVAHHVLGRDLQGRLVAVSRVLPPGATFAEASLGRVVTAPTHRGVGLGKALMAQTLALLERLHGRTPVRIAAQAHLRRFYEGFGFGDAGAAPYLLDGIPHVDLLRPA